MPPRPGAFAERVRAPIENLVVIPDAMPAQEAALAEPIAVACHAVHHGARLLPFALPGACCVVLGGGAIGLGCALVLREAGAGENWLIVSNAARRDTLMRAGVARSRAPEDGPGEASADLVVDAVGSAATRGVLPACARGGRDRACGPCCRGAAGLDVRRLSLQEIILTGTYCEAPAEFRTVVGLLVERRFGALDWLETRPLAQGAQAVADIVAGRVAAAKIVLVP
jgi:L-iditol 2-dehydrogenase